MKHHIAIGFVALALGMGGRAYAQLPTGNDINSAIPIYFGQVVNDLADSKTAPQRVYSISLAKGQKITATLSIASTASNAAMQITLWSSAYTTLANCSRYGDCQRAGLAEDIANGHGVALSYTASTSGVYYINTAFGSPSVSYTLKVDSVGPVIPTTNPTSAGCVSGQVDSMTYSLQLLTTGVPDTASIGGT